MKDWADDLEDHVRVWSERLEKSGRGWWPQFVYHFTDVRNAISILNDGELLSRSACAERGAMLVDNANPSVIEYTDPDHLGFVRFFFRPRTPTQYANEGIKTSAIERGHCPVPVFFLFDFVRLIGRDDAHFSRGTMAVSAHGYSQRREYFREIPFADVYHDSGLGYGDTPRKRAIKQARHAEVLIPGSLTLGAELRAVYCRTPAERLTLLHGLSEGTRQLWGRLIRTGIDPLFYRHRPHIQAVRPSGPDRMTIELFKPTAASLPIRLRFRPDGTSRNHTFEGEFPAGKQNRVYRLPREYESGVLEYHIGDALAFHARLRLTDVPV